jgi:hypothetical protein
MQKNWKSPHLRQTISLIARHSNEAAKNPLQR